VVQVTADDLTLARAFLDADKRWAELTDEQRAAESKRRQILGSSDDCHALTRHERNGGA
jgi:hypothetical protein